MDTVEGLLAQIPRIAEVPRPSGHDALVDYSDRTELARVSRYNIEPGTVVRMITDQNGRCAVCRDPITIGTCHVDHDHKTGKVRGMLCVRCNTGIGMFRDSPALIAAAHAYPGRDRLA